jgi:hypothetical protein
VTLSELQEAFWSRATAPAQAQAHDTSQLFVSTRALSAAARMQVYADMFVWRQLDCLRADFPALAALLGDDAFDTLARGYLAEQPSRHHSLAVLGRALPDYVAAVPDMQPTAADLARLEWARSEVFEAADSGVLAAPRALDRPLHVIPALRVLHIERSALEVWQAFEEGLPAPALAQPRSDVVTVVVWRKQHDVFHVAIQAEEAKALERARSGQTLARICEQFAHASDPVAAAFRTISSWFNEGWIADTDHTTDTPPRRS